MPRSLCMPTTNSFQDSNTYDGTKVENISGVCVWQSLSWVLEKLHKTVVCEFKLVVEAVDLASFQCIQTSVMLTS